MLPFSRKRTIFSLSKYALFACVLALLLFHFVFFQIKLKLSPTSTCDIQHGNCASAEETSQRRATTSSSITIVITICGDTSLAQGLNALKSALILSDVTLHFVVMTDQVKFNTVAKQLDLMKTAKSNFSYELRAIQYPNKRTAPLWRKLFKECASQRLFLPDILREKDSILYIDTDVLFISPVEQVWLHFEKMNSTQIAAMSPESEDFSNSWYHRFAKHPYYGSYGLNSGVMLMNLTRMRAFGWVERLEPILQEYRSKIVWGDQDIINVIFHFNPDKLYLFGCNWNYRPDHCVYSSTCKEAKKEGIRIVHGNRGVFLNDKQPEFRALYEAFAYFEFTDQLAHDSNKLIKLAGQIRGSLSSLPNPSNCAKVSHLFWQQIANQTTN